MRTHKDSTLSDEIYTIDSANLEKFNLSVLILTNTDYLCTL